MSALASTNQELLNDSVAQISANARVDYILRFSKQAVVVLDSVPEAYSAVGSQFLGSIPNHHNAAYLSISPKLNDIQIRARIIEQLFYDQAFDPEKSIAVSLINLVKSSPQTLSIVIEHAQLLSLQLLHELSQLAEIAKKSNLEINVLMLGDMSIGALLYENQSLFNKKISVLSAQSGQLLSISSKQFKPQLSLLSWTANKTLLAAFSVLILLSLGTVWYLANRNVTEFSGLNPADTAMVSTADNTLVLDSARSSTGQAETSPTPVPANQHDIFLALTTNIDHSEEAKQSPQVADVSDVMVALQAHVGQSTSVKMSGSSNKEERLNANDITVQSAEKLMVAHADKIKVSPAVSMTKPVVGETKTNDSLDSIAVKNNYYANSVEGYAVQLAGFRQAKVRDEFIEQYQNSVELHSYQRIQSGQPYWVVTTVAYLTREEALASISQLPEQLKSRSPWVKSIASINSEQVMEESRIN